MMERLLLDVVNIFFVAMSYSFFFFFKSLFLASCFHTVQKRHFGVCLCFVFLEQSQGHSRPPPPPPHPLLESPIHADAELQFLLLRAQGYWYTL